MNHAKETDFEAVKEIFYQHKEWFPHIRTDYMKREIAKGNLIYDNDVVITYKFYKRKQKIGGAIAQQGDCVLHQIAAKHQNGSASQALQKFFEFVKPRRVFLSVRSDNEIAKKFYVKNNMKLVSTTTWAKGTLPGDVYLYDR